MTKCCMEYTEILAFKIRFEREVEWVRIGVNIPFTLKIKIIDVSNVAGGK